MKQETLEEVIERLYPENWESIMDGQHDSNSYERNAFINGAKWQQERSYSEEEIMTILYCFHYDLVNSNFDTKEEWFKQFKKK